MSKKENKRRYFLKDHRPWTFQVSTSTIFTLSILLSHFSKKLLLVLLPHFEKLGDSERFQFFLLRICSCHCTRGSESPPVGHQEVITLGLQTRRRASKRASSHSRFQHARFKHKSSTLQRSNLCSQSTENLRPPKV